jgi:hypothetical protein
MNRVIKELSKKATSYADTLDVADQRIYQEIRDREFAELIVRKCISEVAMMGVVHYENPDISWAVNLIIGNLKETFELDKLKEKNI